MRLSQQILLCLYDSHNKYLMCLCDSLNKYILCLCDSLNKYYCVYMTLTTNI